MAECIEVVADAFAALEDGEMTQPLRSVFVPPDANGLMAWMPAHHSGAAPVFGMKVLCLVPSNPTRGLDAHQGLVLVSDGTTGQLRALLDASPITAIRTAAVSALATRLLARADASTLAIVGTGVQALGHLESIPHRAADRARPHRGPNAGAGAGVRRRARGTVPVRDRGQPERRGGRARRRHRRHRDELARADPRARVAGAGHARERGRREPAHPSRARHGDGRRLAALHRPAAVARERGGRVSPGARGGPHLGVTRARRARRARDRQGARAAPRTRSSRSSARSGWRSSTSPPPSTSSRKAHAAGAGLTVEF